VENLVDGDVSSKAKIRNNPVTSYFRGHSIFGDTAAKNLANLTLEGGVCACKGADGAYFLQAMNQKNIVAFGEEAAFEEMRIMAEGQTESWKITKDAYAGTSSTRNSELAEGIVQALEDPSRLYGRLSTELEESVAGLESEIEEIENIINPEEE
jgi:hypothetical protein